MAAVVKKSSVGMKYNVDRISDLPEFILHHILSFLGTKEACRVTVLSKKWASVWGTIPFLNFHIDNFMGSHMTWSRFINGDYYDKDSVLRFVNCINRVMQRYSKEGLRVKTFALILPMVDSNLVPFIDEWIHILVLGNIEELRLTFFVKDYTLPKVLLSARSLRLLSCCGGVKLSNYGVIKLTALQVLTFDGIHLDEDMLQSIISVCPLLELTINSCVGVRNISIPSSSKIENLHLRSINENGIINLETAGNLRNFSYHGIVNMWPFKMKAGALKNLRNLHLYCAAITDGNFFNIISELNFLMCLSFHSCTMLSSIHILSGCLKELVLDGCGNLGKAVIDTPNLVSFYYIGENDTSLSFTNIHPKCATYFSVMTEYVTSSWFAKVKKFLMRSKNCTLLNIRLMSNLSDSMRIFRADNLGNYGPPFEVRELKLSLTVQWTPTVSSLTAVVDGLFWCSRPELLSISTSLDFENKFVKMLVEVLKKKVKCWKDPLKDFEVVSADCTGLLAKYEEDDSDNLEIQFRLHW